MGSGTEVRDFSEKPQNGMEKTDQPVAKKQNTNAPTESQSSQRNSTLYTISHPNTVIHSISRLPITTPAPTTMAYLNLPLSTKNGHLVPTLASLPRIAPKPV